MDRRRFLRGAGTVCAASVMAARNAGALLTPTQAAAPGDWQAFRQLFPLDWNKVHMAAFFLTSHPRPVQEAVERHRRGLDSNPFQYVEENVGAFERKVRSAAVEYFGGQPDDYAMTDSTTMGLGTVYTGLRLQPGQQVLTSEHDHWSTHHSLDLAAQRNGVMVKKVALYDDPAAASEEEIVVRLTRALTPQTRIVALTWVHSSTGVKLPIRRIADALTLANRDRAPEDRALLCVDGVHGFGVEDATAQSLGCDLFVAGCHKWLFGPRGTGLIWARPEAWKLTQATIPSFDGMWRMAREGPSFPQSAEMTPGGFHSFEHRWALPEAFQLHLRTGKARIAARIHELNRQCKEGLAKMPNVKLYTPMADSLSAGLVCFDIKNKKPADVVHQLLAKGIIASTTPYAVTYARLAPSLMTTPDDVERTLREVGALAG